MAEGIFGRLGGLVTAARGLLIGKPTPPQERNGYDGNYTGVAPPPMVDKYPNVIGSALTLTVIAASYRSCTQGYRQPYVDILDELLEREPHGFASLSQRILMTAGARIIVRAAEAEKGSADEREAQENAALVQRALDCLPGRTHAFAELLWSLYYGIVGQEILWEPQAQGILPAALQFIHSRRLSYPDQNAWDLHVWDQGAVGAMLPGSYPTERFYGIRVKDYPDKFIIHTPHVRGDYPTRDGLGREIAIWMALKGMAARVTSQLVERFSKPWALAYYTTGNAESKYPRTATGEDGGAGDGQSDIEKADVAIRALGTGSLSGAILPDSIKVVLEQLKGEQLKPLDFMQFCDKQISLAVLLASDTMDPGASGSRAAVQTRKEGTVAAARYDAANFGETLMRDFAGPIIRINRPHAAHLIPTIDLAIEEKPDPKYVMEIASKAVAVHMPVDADKLGGELGLPLVENTNKGADGKLLPRMLYPAKPVEEPPFAAPVDPTPEEKAAAAQAQQEAAAQAQQGTQDAPDEEDEPQDDGAP